MFPSCYDIINDVDCGRDVPNMCFVNCTLTQVSFECGMSDLVN